MARLAGTPAAFGTRGSPGRRTRTATYYVALDAGAARRHCTLSAGQIGLERHGTRTQRLPLSKLHGHARGPGSLAHGGRALGGVPQGAEAVMWSA